MPSSVPSVLAKDGICHVILSVGAGQRIHHPGAVTGAVTGVIDRLEEAGFVQRGKDPADRRRVIIEPFPDRIEREIAPLFASIGQAMGDLCARYSNRELAVIRDFIAGFQQRAFEQAGKLRNEVSHQ